MSQTEFWHKFALSGDPMLYLKYKRNRENKENPIPELRDIAELHPITDTLK